MEKIFDLDLYFKIIKEINELSKKKEVFTTYDFKNELREAYQDLRLESNFSFDVLNECFEITSGMIRKKDMKYFERKIGVSKLLEELEIIDDYILVLRFKKRDVSL